MKRILLIAMLLSSCATTEQGKSVDRSNMADLGSTAIALSQGAVETNPIGVGLVPLKMALGKAIVDPMETCEERRDAAGVLNTGFYGISVHNLAVAFEVSNPWGWGIAAGAAYWKYKDKLEPEVYSCDKEAVKENIH